MDSGTAKAFLMRWAVDTVAVLVAANIVPGIAYESPGSLIVASLLLGVLNAILRPLLLLLSLPLVLFTLGLFVWVINAFLLFLVGTVVKSFQVDGFGVAMLGALVISLVSLILNNFLGLSTTRVQSHRGKGRPGGHENGNGPVIDV